MIQVWVALGCRFVSFKENIFDGVEELGKIVVVGKELSVISHGVIALTSNIVIADKKKK